MMLEKMGDFGTFNILYVWFTIFFWSGSIKKDENFILKKSNISLKLFYSNEIYYYSGMIELKLLEPLTQCIQEYVFDYEYEF